MDEEIFLVEYEDAVGSPSSKIDCGMSIRYQEEFIVLTMFTDSRSKELNLTKEEFLQFTGNIISFGNRYKDKFK